MAATIFETHLTEILQRTHHVKSFRFAAQEGMTFQAGQFFGLTLWVNGQEQQKYFSFSNSPTEQGYIEFTKKLTGSGFSMALEALKPGDRVKIKMPLGSFVLDETVSKHAFLSGGIGITPIRSMWKYALDRHLLLDMVLLYGNRAPEDIAFKTDLDEMARLAKNLRVVFSLDTQAACPADWKGRCGFIDAEMIREELPDYAERTFYVCGPPVMVSHLLCLLKTELKVPDNQIKKENFTGY